MVLGTGVTKRLLYRERQNTLVPVVVFLGHGIFPTSVLCISNLFWIKTSASHRIVQRLDLCVDVPSVVDYWYWAFTIPDDISVSQISSLTPLAVTTGTGTIAHGVYSSEGNSLMKEQSRVNGSSPFGSFPARYLIDSASSFLPSGVLIASVMSGRRF